MGAFVEYVVRPMTEDIKAILDQLVALNIGISQQTIRRVALAMGCWHLLGEVIRAVSYIIIVWMVCGLLRSVL